MKIAECEKYLESAKQFNDKQKKILKQRIELIKYRLKIKTTEELADFAENIVDINTLRRWEKGLVKPHPLNLSKFNEIISAKLDKSFFIEIPKYPFSFKFIDVNLLNYCIIGGRKRLSNFFKSIPHIFYCKIFR